MASLSDLTDPAAVRQAIAEFDQLGRSAFLSRYGFARSREYMLLGPSGNLYDSKAIVGAAFGVQHPTRGPLTSGDFVGGEATVERKLRDLGFDVVRVGESWSRDEVELAVADYFAMLSLEAAGMPFNKSEHNDELRGQLRNRSKASIELKHQNISAILEELGVPRIRGYKPRSNVQELLREIVHTAVVARQGELEKVIDDLEHFHPAASPSYVAALVDPPDVLDMPPRARVRLARKCDYAARDECNRTLGRAGEEWVVGFERFRLVGGGRQDLAERIDWVADRIGDGMGYDVRSFELEDALRYIEVKTTSGPATTQFLVSENEVECSKELGDAFCLYRVFDFRESPRLFILRGELDRHVSLSPTNFRARLRSARAT